MQERKLLLSQLSDSCVALPGGLGTLEEFFEFWDASKLNISSKPIGLLNINNYYDKLLEFIDLSVKQGFIKIKNLDLVQVSSSPDELIELLSSCEKNIPSKENNNALRLFN